jgi:hypothetical protein
MPIDLATTAQGGEASLGPGVGSIDDRSGVARWCDDAESRFRVTARLVGVAGSHSLRSGPRLRAFDEREERDKSLRLFGAVGDPPQPHRPVMARGGQQHAVR